MDSPFESPRPFFVNIKKGRRGKRPQQKQGTKELKRVARPTEITPQKQARRYTLACVAEN